MKQLICLVFCFQVLSLLAQNQQDTLKVTIDGHTYLAYNSDEKDQLTALETGIRELESQLKAHNQTKDSLVNCMVQANDQPEKVQDLSVQIKAQKASIQIYKESLEKQKEKLKSFAQANSVEDINQDSDFEQGWDFDFDWDEFKFRRDDERFRGHWAGLEIGFCGYVDANHKTKLSGELEQYELKQSHSWSFDLNFLEINLPLSKPNFGLVTGMGAGFYYYHFANNFELQKVDGVTVAVPTETDFSKNRLFTSFVNFPLILEVQFPRSKKHQFHLGIGVVGSIRLYSDQEMTWSEDGIRYSLTKKGEMTLNSFRYGTTVRLGYGFVHLFANYTFTPLFKKDKGPELYPFQVGIVLLNY